MALIPRAVMRDFSRDGLTNISRFRSLTELLCGHSSLERGPRIERLRVMSNYCACPRADVARPFFVMLKLHQCQRPRKRADCVVEVSVGAQRFGATRETCIKMPRREIVRRARKNCVAKCNVVFSPDRGEPVIQAKFIFLERESRVNRPDDLRYLTFTISIVFGYYSGPIRRNLFTS